MTELEQAKVEGARCLLRRLAAECADQKRNGIDVVLIKQLALMDNEALAQVVKEGEIS